MSTPIRTTETHRSLTARAWDFTPTAVAILRIGAGLLFMQHGLQKLFGLFGGFGGTPGATAPLASLMGVAGVLELVGGVMLILGLFVRPVALILAIEMIVAYVKSHLPQGGMPIQNGGAGVGLRADLRLPRRARCGTVQRRCAAGTIGAA